MSSYRSWWLEFGKSWFISSSVGFNLKWWGFKPVDVSVDFEYVDLDLGMHIGPVNAHFTIGREIR